MNNQSTIELLREMKFSAMAHEFVTQLEDPKTYSVLEFEERFALLVDAEWNRRQNNKLTRLINQQNSQHLMLLFKASSIMRTGNSARGRSSGMLHVNILMISITSY